VKRALAALNHPNIATIHGLEDARKKGNAGAKHDGIDLEDQLVDLAEESGRQRRAAVCASSGNAGSTADIPHDESNSLVLRFASMAKQRLMRVMRLSWSRLVALAVVAAVSASSSAAIESAVQAPARLTVLVIHGPNLNLLGRREPQIYGTVTLDQINARLAELAKEINVDLITMQSNSEGAIVDAFHKHIDGVDGGLINGAGLTFSSVSIHDAIKAMPFPVIEVHISNLATRDEIHQRSIITSAARGSVMGLGWRSYTAALRALADIVREEKAAKR
jgi:3-dehydroquinate dehydratase-2